ncbi:hypothetical protein [Streptomyces sp. NBC_01483]|uniref:hypothetical protein n=1 Tax=Streptomyces sp. NBC_01483 TaxID=2903883 RepID=UPI002E353A2A|nr:hypothetical protein [Streptomyces sp. NBC_01483]
MEKGNASGRFQVDSPLVALSAVDGSLLGLLQLKSSARSEESGPGADEQMAELILRMLGSPPRTPTRSPGARCRSRRPRTTS